MRKMSLVRHLGAAVGGLALGAFIALPAVAEQPSHGFHTPPHVVKVTKPHKPHPALNPNAP